MAKIVTRTWTSRGPLGRKVKHVAYGYTLMVNGHQERKVSPGGGRGGSVGAPARIASIAYSRLRPLGALELARPTSRCRLANASSASVSVSLAGGNKDAG